MLSRFFKKAKQPVRQSSHHRKLRPQLEVLEAREVMSASNPVAGVAWTAIVDFHGHFDGAAAHQPTAADFKVEFQWGDGSSTVSKDVIELQPGSDNFEATATHTYATAGNTSDSYTIEITNLLDPVYNWIQESYWLTVGEGPVGTTSNPLTGGVSSGSSTGTGTTPPAANPSGPLDLVGNLINLIAPPAQADNLSPDQQPAPIGSPAQGTPKSPLKGAINHNGNSGGTYTPGEGVPDYPSPYSKPKKGYIQTSPPPAKKPAQTPHKPKAPLTPLAPKKDVPSPPKPPTKKKLTGHASNDPVSNPSPNPINDPIAFRIGGSLNEKSLQTLLEKLEKADPKVNWTPTVDALKARIQKAIAKATVAMEKLYPGQKASKVAVAVTGTLSATGKGKFTLVIPEDQGSVPQDNWALYLNLGLHEENLQ
jgi:hypothetical protein